MPPELPHDIWLLIASFVAKHHLLTLTSVNRPLYNIVLDVRYSEIQWVKLDQEMSRMLLRLQDPHIAIRVRRLHIRAWFIQYLLNSVSLSEGRRPKSQLSKYMSEGLSTVSKHVSMLKKSFTPTPTLGLPQFRLRNSLPTPIRILSPPDRLGPTLSSSSSLVDLMLDAFKRMLNLTEYKLEWRDLPVTKDTRAFLCRPDSNHLSGLRKIVLHAQLPQFNDLLSQSMFNLSGLQELELYFEYNTPSTSGTPTVFDITRSVMLNETILSNTIAPFIASFCTSLSSLKISSGAECNHCHLFNSVISDLFPRLRNLSICIPFDTEHLSDTAGLVRLLQVHAGTLLHVELQRAGGGDMVPLSMELAAWSIVNQACLHPSAVMTFTYLESLAIPVLEVYPTLQLVRRSAPTLKKLCLLGKYLVEDEVKEVVGVFASYGGGNLRSLSINIRNLTPMLMDTFAIGLPGLRALSLVLHKHEWVYLQVTHQCFSQQARWGLHDLSIYLGRHREDGVQSVADRIEDRMMIHLLGSLPSVRSIKGRGISPIVLQPANRFMTDM